MTSTRHITREFSSTIDPYGNYPEGVIVDGNPVRKSDGNVYVQCIHNDSRRPSQFGKVLWANVHMPNSNLHGYGIRFWLDSYEAEQANLTDDS